MRKGKSLKIKALDAVDMSHHSQRRASLDFRSIEVKAINWNWYIFYKYLTQHVKTIVKMIKERESVWTSGTVMFLCVSCNALI